MKSFKTFFGLALLVISSAVMADSTFSPPSVGAMSSGSVPVPPVCNASNQMLRWTGSAWQCIANPGVTSAGKGSVVSTGASCPGGTVAHHVGMTSGGGCAMPQFCQPKPIYLCAKK